MRVHGGVQVLIVSCADCVSRLWEHVSWVVVHACRRAADRASPSIPSTGSNKLYDTQTGSHTGSIQPIAQVVDGHVENFIMTEFRTKVARLSPRPVPVRGGTRHTAPTNEVGTKPDTHYCALALSYLYYMRCLSLFAILLIRMCTSSLCIYSFSIIMLQ